MPNQNFRLNEGILHADAQAGLKTEGLRLRVFWPSFLLAKILLDVKFLSLKNTYFSQKIDIIRLNTY